ncbi:MAG: SGNH/GDSL hydrolase family protein, partial [Acidobacteria bacterium]|nr:SGNH/GDSL hydrolase family protein [Acidobacteriota bacterium]
MFSRSVMVVFLVISIAATPIMAQVPGLNFFNMVVLGDSLAAGFISGGWNVTGQNNSFVAHFARHVRTFVFQPLVPEPGFPPELQLVSPGFPPVLAPKPGTVTSPRLVPLIIPTNLAVPGANVASALRERPSLPIDSAADIVLGIPALVVPNSAPVASQVEMAEFLRPSVALVWLGSNDALGAALGGSAARLTDLSSFTSDYRTMVSRLRTVGANLILLNVPDVTAIAAVVSIPTASALTGVPAALIASRLGVSTSDFLLLSHLDAYIARITGQTTAPLSDAQVLTAAEVATIRERINQFNNVIQTVAFENQAVLVDIHAAFNQIAANGLQIGTKRLTTLPLGGIFSLDGVHPTYTAQA